MEERLGVLYGCGEGAKGLNMSFQVNVKKG